MSSENMIPNQPQQPGSKKRSFSIGNIPIYGDLVLAPMDGITDLPFRQLTRKLGSAFSICEFINPTDVIFGHPRLEQKLSFGEIERPIVYQIYDDEPERILRAAILLEKRGPDIIDINMGCPAKTVSNRGAGAGLLKFPKKIGEIFKILSSNLQVPITGKIRLGWDEQARNYLEVAKIIEDNGGSLITVHGRTKAQGYGGFADWDAIGEIKQSVSIPVLGNGDVRTVKDIDQIILQTNCDGVMIGREAIKNPWIFSRLDREKIPSSVVYHAMSEHLQGMIGFYGSDRGMTLFRKFVKNYLQPYKLDHSQILPLVTTTNIDEFIDLLSHIFTNPNLFNLLDENIIP